MSHIHAMCRVTWNLEPIWPPQKNGDHHNQIQPHHPKNHGPSKTLKGGFETLTPLLSISKLGPRMVREADDVQIGPIVFPKPQTAPVDSTNP